MREIVMDTETTGLDALKGDRLIEIGCVEIYNRIPTGRKFHVFINPERDVPEQAVAVHGLTTEFLADKPLFSAVAQSFLEFVQDDPLVIHNAKFDIGFLNPELQRIGLNTLSFDRVVDTLELARRKHPAGPNSLDALCRRYSIDNSSRDKHGALIDSLLLAEVYVDLLGERQAALGLGTSNDQPSSGVVRTGRHRPLPPRPVPLQVRVSEEERQAHRSFIEKIGNEAVWLKYRSKTGA